MNYPCEKLQQNIARLRKVFNYFFLYDIDFEKSDQEIITDIFDKIKTHVQSILLINQYVEKIIEETHKRYRIKDNTRLNECDSEYLFPIYESIIRMVYEYLYPDSWV